MPLFQLQASDWLLAFSLVTTRAQYVVENGEIAIENRWAAGDLLVAIV